MSTTAMIGTGKTATATANGSTSPSAWLICPTLLDSAHGSVRPSRAHIVARWAVVVAGPGHTLYAVHERSPNWPEARILTGQ